MNSGDSSPASLCFDCGSHHVEVRGPIVDDALVHCTECGAVVSRWMEFVSSLATRLKQQEHRPIRWVRYYARRQSDPSVCHLILGIPLDEFFWRSLPHRPVSSSFADVEVIRDVPRGPGGRADEQKRAA